MNCQRKKICCLKNFKSWLDILQKNYYSEANSRPTHRSLSAKQRTYQLRTFRTLSGISKRQVPSRSSYSCLNAFKSGLGKKIWTISDREISGKAQMITEMYGGHIPVLLNEVIEVLDPQNSKLYVDMTFGAGGHTKRILNVAPEARVVCLDQDSVAYKTAVSLSDLYSPGQILPIHGRFSELPEKLIDIGIEPGTVDGFLFDVGAASFQFDSAERGFSLSKDGYLDMRMDQTRTVTAMDVVNNLDEKQLGDIIKKYGEERNYRKIATALVESRYAFGKITRTKQLADIVESVFDEKYQRDKMNRRAHVATRTFQALRIFVNNELNEINNGLTLAHYFLKPKGKCLVISFHSLEDRLFKRHFQGIDLDDPKNMSLRERMRMRNSIVSHESDDVYNLLNTKKWTPLFKKVIEPSAIECQDNPRARSSKLRAALKSV